jgi:hypothetical protein
MDKERIVKITDNLYRLTLLFPKKEPLRYKIREAAIEILASPAEKDFEILDTLFEVAKLQNWVRPEEVLAIQSEYGNLMKDLIDQKPQKVVAIEAVSQPVTKGLAKRQEKILDILKEKGKAQVWEVKKIFPQISKRTLRRDFELMFKQGIVQRMGEKNNTFYQIKT